MDARPAALFLTPESPWPAYGGGAVRSASILEYLLGRYAVDAIVFWEPHTSHPERILLDRGVRAVHTLELPVHSRRPAARALRNLSRAIRATTPYNDRFAGFERKVEAAIGGKRYDLAVIEHFWCAAYWKQLAPVTDALWLNMHNVDSVYYARGAAAKRHLQRWVFSRFARAAREFERQWLPQFTGLLITSEDDRKKLGRIVSHPRVSVIPNAIPLYPKPARKSEELLVFSGNLEYDPNRAAVRYFRREIWPALRAARPGLRWLILGMNGHAVRDDVAGDPRIEMLGPVEDAVCEIARARAAVVPLLVGSGTRFKILEAWAAGVPVVSTTLGAEGLGAEHGRHLLIADTPENFRDAVLHLLDSAELRNRIIHEGRRYYEENYTWEAVWRRLSVIDL